MELQSFNSALVSDDPVLRALAFAPGGYWPIMFSTGFLDREPALYITLVKDALDKKEIVKFRDLTAISLVAALQRLVPSSVEKVEQPG